MDHILQCFPRENSHLTMYVFCVCARAHYNNSS